MGLHDQQLDMCFGEMTIPFTMKEYKSRIKKVRDKMKELNIDLLYCTAPVSLYYLTGFQSEWYQGEEPLEWLPLSGIAIPADEDRMIYFDRQGHEAITSTHVIGENLEIRVHTYRDRERGLTELQYIVKNLKQEGWLNDRVALEKLSHRPNPLVSAMMEEALTAEGCQVVNGSDIVREIRVIKSRQEIAYHRIASKLCDIGIRAAAAAVKPGVTENEVKAEALYAMIKAGSEDPGIPLPVTSGSRAIMGHALTSQKVIMPGEMVFFDCCGVFKRYHVNTIRPICAGEPDPKVLDRLNKAGEAVNVLKGLIKPGGMPLKELSRGMREYYKETGLWPDRKWLGGYELGPAFPPSWIGSWVYNITEEDNDDRIFVPGNVMNHEIQFFLPRDAGIAIYIDTVVFEEHEAYTLSEIQPEPIIV